MSTIRNRYVRAAGAFALVAALASCTANSTDPTPAPSSSDTGTPDTSNGLPPVEALQAEIIGTVDEEAWARVENDRFEAAVAACMQAAGFEYTPEEYVPEDEEDTSSPEWVAQHGYGIATFEDDDWEEDEDWEPTPNDLYLESLSDEEIDAYWLAYDGEAVEDDEDLDLEDLDEDGDGEIDLGDLEIGEDGEIDLSDLEDADLFEDGDLGGEGGGCQGAGYDALTENPLPYDFPEHQDVLTLLDEMYAEMSVSDALLDAEESWITCMDTAGYPDLETVDDAEYLVYDAYDAAWEQVPDDADDIDPALLEPVIALELAVAKADHDCRASSGLDQAYLDAQIEAEDAFIAEHREALVAFFEDMGAALEA